MGRKSLQITSDPSVPVPASADPSVDRINNLTQKEQSLSASGVTRYKYMLVIAEALDAVKQVERPDDQGNYKWIEVPDTARREWGAEQAAKLFGDMIERKEIEHDIGDKTLDKFKSMTVAQLRARAMEILLTQQKAQQNGLAIPAPDAPALSQDATQEAITIQPDQVSDEEY